MRKTPVVGGLAQNGGGGGGGAGRIRINTQAGSETYSRVLPSGASLATVGRMAMSPP